jgi:hypothetical protein
MEIKYKDSTNKVHQIPEGYEHLMEGWPVGYVKITDEEAEALRPKPAPLTYADLRAQAYPSIADQLDSIFHVGIDGWKAEIQAVKDKYPKGVV